MAGTTQAAAITHVTCSVVGAGHGSQGMRRPWVLTALELLGTCWAQHALRGLSHLSLEWLGGHGTSQLIDQSTHTQAGCAEGVRMCQQMPIFVEVDGA